ncbi:MAG: VUT family protein [Maricaulaceae bacterium]
MAFAISEIVDWAVYTFTKRPLSQRILLSSAFSAPIDSTVFLFGASFIREGMLTFANVITSVFGKMVGAVVVSALVFQRERAAAGAAMVQAQKS